MSLQKTPFSWIGIMNVTRRCALTASIETGLSAINLSTVRADFGGPVFELREGGEEFWLATNATAPGGTRAPRGKFVRARTYCHREKYK